MRRTLLMIAAVALLLTQCRKPAVELPTAGPANENMVSMTVTVGHGGKTDINGTTGAITWRAGDRLYVGDGSKYIGCLTLQSGAGSATGTFSGSVSATESTDFGLYYLGSNPPVVTSGATTVEIPFGTQTGLRENLGSCHIGYGTAKGKVEGTSVILASTAPVTMTSKVAIAYFEFKDGETPYPGRITLSGEHIYSWMTVKFSGAEDGKFTGKEGTEGNAIRLMNRESSQKYVMLVPTGTGEETLEFGGGAEGTTTLYKGIEANKFYCLGEGDPIEVEVTAAPTPTREYVDLGLPSDLLWATCNLGASKPEDYGDYYAWGEILPYYADGHSLDNPCSTSDWRDMTTGAGNTNISNGYAWKTYSKDGLSSFVEWATPPYDATATTKILTSDYDAATVAWGSAWRMPTDAEISELISNTTQTWKDANAEIIIDGQTVSMPVAGCYCVSTNAGCTGEYVFFPAAGYRNGTNLILAGSEGDYWSSSLKMSPGTPDSGRKLRFLSGSRFRSDGNRYEGYPVRPVWPTKN